MLKDRYPVVIVGTGPTGLVLAHLLVRQGVEVLVIDRNPGTVAEARAVSIDDESLRTIQSAGMIDRVFPSIVPSYGVHYYSWRHRLFAKIEPTSTEFGFPKRNAFRQDVLVRQLCEGLQERQAQGQGVEVRFGHELVRFEDRGEFVQLEIQTPQGLRQVRADWLVACDGGRSTVREALGIAMEGSTYRQRWCIVDLIGRSNAFRHTRTYCDPVRPAIRLPGPDATVRYEFMLKPGENDEFALDETRLRAWIAQREPSDARLKIMRKVVYTFHARMATRWRAGRILLAGDAAHLTPPFAGQGMNSGVRDAANLAWKLAAVLQGRAGESLLDTYEMERKPHAWSLIRMALRIGSFMQPASVLGAALFQGALKLVCLVPAARDYILHLKFKPKPRFYEGFFDASCGAGSPVPPGQLFPQPRMQQPGGSEVLLDEWLGPGFSILQWADSPELAWPAGLQARVVKVLRQEDDFLPGLQAQVRDVSGVIGRLLAQAGAGAVVIRPDRHVLAYCPQRSDEVPPSLTRILARHRP